MAVAVILVIVAVVGVMVMMVMWWLEHRVVAVVAGVWEGEARYKTGRMAGRGRALVPRGMPLLGTSGCG